MHLEIIEADFGNKTHSRDVLFLTNAYAEDEMGAGESLSAEASGRLIDELKNLPTAFSFIAYADGRPAGIANCFIGFATFEAKKLINIHDLSVLPEFRGRGIGEELLSAVQKKAKRLKCCRMTLEVRDDNDRARRLYERFGFEDGDPPMLFMTKEFYW